MSGKRIKFISFLMGCLVMSACSMAASSLPNRINGDLLNISAVNSPAASLSPSGLSQKPIEYKQKTENLPGIKALTSFPGVFESMSMTLEQIVRVLGTQFDLQENKAENYDTYSFPQYKLAFDFDKVSMKLSTIWLDQIPYYVYSGVYKTQDFNGDGSPEKIAAYEDQQYNGHLLVIDGAKPAFSDAKLDFFGGKCNIDVIPNFGQNKENLILVKTQGTSGGDVLEWNAGKLTSILPQDYKKLAENSMVTVEGNKAVFMNKERDILYVCPLPERVVKNIDGRTDTEVYRLNVCLRPELRGDSIILSSRTSLQVMLLNNYNFIDSTDGTFCDVANATQEYQYLGQGNWKEQKLDGGPKYENAAVVNVLPEDLSIGGLTLYDHYKSLKQSLKIDLSSYTPTDLNDGVILKEDGLCVGVTQGQITYLSLEKGSVKSTSKGLKLSDTREKVLSLYGLPDKGFMDDPVWTYYVTSEKKSQDESSVLVNTLNVEFDSEKVCRIWMSAYVTAY